MCGICGVFLKRSLQSNDHEALISMRDVMTYRGPDDAGIYMKDHVGLGVRRLSIIDIIGGHQPLSIEDGTIWIAYNGEVYNYRELRRNLINKGYHFKTNSDTEVILQLYKDCGLDFIHELNGQYAIAIWDRNLQRLLLARDRLGIKPLYYMEVEDGLLFASEIKCLLKWPGVIPEVNSDLLEEYLFFRHTTGEETLYKGIYNLMPGHILVCKQSGEREVRRYWQIDLEATGTARGSEYEYQENMRALLKDSIKLRLISDVPIGAMTSGGLDSSLITAYANEYHTGLMKTFSVGFHEEQFDETIYAQMVANKFGTDHHEIKVSNREFSDILPKMIWHNDLPLHHANSVQMYLISKLAKEHVTVLLTGEGADELFCGYPRLKIPYIYFWNDRLPNLLPLFIQCMRSILSDHRMEKLTEALTFDKRSLGLFNSAFVRHAKIKGILTQPLRCTFPYRSKCFNITNHRGITDFMNDLLCLELQTYLLSLLDRQDRMSMAASVESRVPYLDHRFVEYVNTLPLEFKIRHYRAKYLLKKVARNILPREIINRRKRGFENPIADWLRDKDGIGRYLDLLLDNTFYRLDYFNRTAVETLVREHRSGVLDHSDLLWQMINLALWQQEFIDK